MRLRVLDSQQTALAAAPSLFGRINLLLALAISVQVATLSGCAVEVGDEDQAPADYEEPVDETDRDPGEDGAAENSESEDEDDGLLIESVIPGPTWKMVAIIFRNVDADYVDSNGTKRHVRLSMSAARRDLCVQTANTMETKWETWNGGKAAMTLTKIEVTTPIRHISRMDNGTYWVSPTDVAAALDTHAPKGRYDSVFVMWDPGASGELEHLPGVYAGWGVSSPPSDGTNGMTYATLQPASGYGAMVHEWLHGAGGFYRSHGLTVPDPHDNDTYGFRGTYLGSWDYWYRGLLGGTLVKAGRVVGYTSAVFRSGTPRSWIGGTYPAAPMPTLATPLVQAANVTSSGQWVYTQWAPVRRPSHYTMLLKIVNRDGSVTHSLRRYEQPGIDRGNYDYRYFSRTEICEVAR